MDEGAMSNTRSGDVANHAEEFDDEVNQPYMMQDVSKTNFK